MRCEHRLQGCSEATLTHRPALQHIMAQLNCTSLKTLDRAYVRVCKSPLCRSDRPPLAGLPAPPLPSPPLRSPPPPGCSPPSVQLACSYWCAADFLRWLALEQDISGEACLPKWARWRQRQLGGERLAAAVERRWRILHRHSTCMHRRLFNSDCSRSRCHSEWQPAVTRCRMNVALRQTPRPPS